MAAEMLFRKLDQLRVCAMLGSAGEDLREDMAAQVLDADFIVSRLRRDCR